MKEKKESVLRKIGRKLMGKNSRENLTPTEQRKRKGKIAGTYGGMQGGSF